MATTHTQIKETRTVLRDANGDQIYRNVLECVNEGPLDDKGVFVFQIFNTRNALADIFQRVCVVVDVETYVDDRDEAIANGDEYWRGSVYTLEFGDIEVAVAAVRTISDRVNTLVNDFVAYQTSFETPSPDHETLSFPTAEPTIIEERKADYATAVSEYEATQEIAVDDLTAKADADDALSAAVSDLGEWQAEKDKICGNLGSGGVEKGLKPEMDDTGKAFLELYDGTEAFSWATNTTAFKSAVQSFYDSATEITSGGSASVFLKCTVSCPALAGAADVGKAVYQSATSVTGYLAAVAPIDSSTQTWWVSAASGMNATGVTLDGAGGYSVDTIVDTTGAGPYAALLTTLNGELAKMISALDSAMPYKAYTTAAILDHADACTEVSTAVDSKTLALTAAQSDVTSKEAAYITALGAIQAAYAVVISAYDAVKEVCPSWSPDPPLPAQP